MPASGFLLLVPEEEVMELNWGPEETLQAIISVGLTIPPEVHYFKSRPDAEITRSEEDRAESSAP